MNKLGIIVFGHRRRQQLCNILEGLKRQEVLHITHIWMDGYSHSANLKELVEACRKLKNEFPGAEWLFFNGRLGIEKLMIDGLSFMAGKYKNIIVLEDDCFPTHNAVQVFQDTLEEIENDPSVYSVYGHYFDVPREGERFTRFQGWGWATTRKKLLPILSQLKIMFMMQEKDYLDWVASVLTPELSSLLDITPGRDVLHTLARQFSWDSATALLTAMQGLYHRKTPERVIYNCGIDVHSGHFRRSDKNFFRKPPFNMIGADEVWQYYMTTLPSKYQARTYFGLDDLDRKIAVHLPQEQGFFVEVGAYDGLDQSNTLFFERKGWRGVLVEPVLDNYKKCCLNRPLSRVVHAACVPFSFTEDYVELFDVGLMSLVKGIRADENEWLGRGEEIQQISRKECKAPAKTLTAILEKEQVDNIDLLSLDVEGYEKEVLNGMDFLRFRPAYILVEESNSSNIKDYLAQFGYRMIEILNQRTYTRDLLFKDWRSG